jgi:hypothetical protein
MRDIQGPDKFDPPHETTAYKLICDQGFWPYYIEHPPDKAVRMHYHQTDETLYLLKGEMTFTNRAGNRFILRPGNKLFIPEGALHSVVIGHEGAAYIMGLMERIPLETFSVYLPDNGPEFATLLEINYDSSDWENEGKKQEFAPILSKDFTFVGADGRCSGKGDENAGFIGTRTKGGDRKSRHVELKTWPGYEDVVFVSLLVEMAGKTFLNMRAFQREEDRSWRCVRWSNLQVKRSI